MSDNLNNRELNELFERYLENRCEPGEVEILLNHFRQAGNREELRELIYQAMNRPVDSDFENSPEGQHLFARVHREIHEAIGHSEPRRKTAPGKVRKKGSPSRIHRLWPKVAAAAAIVIIVGISWMMTRPPEPPAMVQVATQSGEQQEVTLPDGSTLFLNAGSEFTYPENFAGTDRREVSLATGEAYFDVTENPDKPFIIKAGETTVRVRGTSFNVKAYREDETSRVAVTSGRVEIYFGASNPVSLLPAQQAVWNKPEQKVYKSRIDTADVGAWMQNRMVFNNETLAEVFRVLERHYDIEIRVERRPLLEERVTLKLDNQSLEAVMEVLQFTKQFEYELNAEENAIIVK